MDAMPEDFFRVGLAKPGDTHNYVGLNVTLVSGAQLPGLNTPGISMARIDFAQCGGLKPPHIHPHATEVLTVLEGTHYMGFVTSNLPNNSGNTLFAKVLNKGDVFMFPQGLIHFQFNIGKYPAIAIVALSSQNPCVTTIANAVFEAQPPIPVDVLTKAFQLDEKVVKYLQSRFWVSS